jgi:hypothetical protein
MELAVSLQAAVPMASIFCQKTAVCVAVEGVWPPRMLAAVAMTDAEQRLDVRAWARVTLHAFTAMR